MPSIDPLAQLPRQGAARSGFTLVELLVVISLIAMLISMLLPSLGKSKERARMVQEVSNMRQLMIASSNYALENKSYYPYRVPGEYMLHQVRGSGWDLNKSFFPRYLGERWNAFCLGNLQQLRPPEIWTQYKDQYVTSQYFNFSVKNGTWFVPIVSLEKDNVSGKHAMWSDLTTKKDSNNWLGHDAQETPVSPTGQVASRIDGSAAWIPWADMELMIRVSNHDFYRPKER